MFKYVYIDESGDLGENGSNYIVLAALIIDNPQELGRIIKNMRRNKFKKELRKAFEIKANKSSENVKIHMLKKLNDIKNVKVLYVILEKKKVISNYLKNNQKNNVPPHTKVCGLQGHLFLGCSEIKSGKILPHSKECGFNFGHKDKLYNYIAGKLAKQLIMDDVHIEIRIDRRQGKQLLQQDFNNYFTKCLKDNSNPSKIIIQHSYSHNFAGLQFADMLAWACCQEPPVRNRWHEFATLHVVLEHVQNSTSSSNHSPQAIGILTFQKFEHKDSNYIDILKIEQEVYHVW